MRHKVGKWGKREVLKVYRSFIGIRLSNIPVNFSNGFRMHLATLISLCSYLTTANKKKPSPFLPPLPANSMQIHFWRGTQIWLFCRWKIHISHSSSVSALWTFKPNRRKHESSQVQGRQGVRHTTPLPSSSWKERSSRYVSFTSSILKTFPKSFSDIVIFGTNIAGKSSPMMEVFSSFSMVGVYETRKGLKFVHVTSEVECLPVIDHILQVCFSLRSSSASSPSWSSWTIGELKSWTHPSQSSSQIVGAGGWRVEGLQWEALWLQGHRRPGGVGRFTFK